MARSMARASSVVTLGASTSTARQITDMGIFLSRTSFINSMSSLRWDNTMIPSK